METEASIRGLAHRMSKAFGVKGDSLAEVAGRAGRKLPRRVRADVAILVEAEKLAEHPRLSRRIDPRRIRRAERRVNRYLDRISPASARWGAVLDEVAKIAFLLVTAVLAVFFTLLYRGYFD